MTEKKRLDDVARMVERQKAERAVAASSEGP